MYIPRENEAAIDRMLTQGKVVLVTGARQVGKTTVLRQRLSSSFDYVPLENPRDYATAREDALLFFDNYSLSLIIDEVQRISKLFGTVKFIVDQSDRRGQLVLAGLQTYHLMKGMSESLAGRIRSLEMAGLSLRELIGTSGSGAYVPSMLERTNAPTLRENFDLWVASTTGPCRNSRTSRRTGKPSGRDMSMRTLNEAFVTSSMSAMR